MNCIFAALLLSLSGCTLVFEATGSSDEPPIDAAPAIDAELEDCVDVTELDAYPAIPDNAYYVRSGGDNGQTGGSVNDAWQTFAYALTQLVPGDTLVVATGSYSEELRIDTGVAGAPGMPITIMAAEDGQAQINGNGNHTPCSVRNTNDITLIGLRCVDDVNYAVFVSNSDNVTLRRISANNTIDTPAPLPTSPLYRISSSGNVLLEDVSAIGANPNLVTIINNGAVEIRRLWALSSAVGGQYVINSNDCDECLFQNIVVRSTNSANTYGVLLGRADGATTPANKTKVLGSLIYNQRQNGIVTSSSLNPVEEATIEHVVIARSRAGIFQRSVNQLAVHNVNLAALGGAVGDSSLSINDQDLTPVDALHELNVDLRNSILSGGYAPITVGGLPNVATITAAFNVIHDHVTPNSTAGIEVMLNDTNLDVDPGFNIATYGLGGYLLQPEGLKQMGDGGAAIGAEVIYRYEAGVPTAVPLWPWPMEERIFEETGFTVTWETGRDGEQGEGVWRTLDMVYPACTP